MNGGDIGEAGVLAVEVVQALADRGVTVATAESLTGGLLGAVLTSVPGASAVVVGGVVAYATQAKATLAGVAPELLRDHGPVAAETAIAMAAGVRGRVGADVGIACTGVAGPDPQDGYPPGTVYVATATGGGSRFRSFTGAERLPGDRAAIRLATVIEALELLREVAV